VEKYSSGLLDILKNQKNLYRQLLSLSLEKRSVLIKGNIAELERITKEEETLIIQVGRLEEQRQALHNALANHFALSPVELSISRLIDRIEEPLKTRFAAVFDDINEIIGQIVEANNNNTDLINSSLEYVNFSLNLLTNNSVTPSYTEEELEKRQAAAKIFDRMV